MHRCERVATPHLGLAGADAALGHPYPQLRQACHCGCNKVKALDKEGRALSEGARVLRKQGHHGSVAPT